MSRIWVSLVLVGGLISVSAWSQATSSAATHCKAGERVVFSCPFKHRKTASLCASADLSQTSGTLQYRYGVVGKTPELTFPTLDEGAGAKDHPKTWFQWSHSDRTPWGKRVPGRLERKWSTRDVPPGESVAIRMVFTPIEGHPELNFIIEAMAGPDSRYQGSVLMITESVGRGRMIAEHRCIKDGTVEDLFSLQDIIKQ